MKLRYVTIPAAAIGAVLWLNTTPAFRRDTPDKKYAAEAVLALIVIVVMSLPALVSKLRKPKEQPRGLSWTNPTRTRR